MKSIDVIRLIIATVAGSVCTLTLLHFAVPELLSYCVGGGVAGVVMATRYNKQ